MQLPLTIFLQSVCILLNIFSLVLPFFIYFTLVNIDFTFVLRFIRLDSISLCLLFSAGFILIISILANSFYVFRLIKYRKISVVSRIICFLQFLACILVTGALVIENTSSIGSASILIYISFAISLASSFLTEKEPQQLPLQTPPIQDMLQE
jgi:hypothetical protein